MTARKPAPPEAKRKLVQPNPATISPEPNLKPNPIP